MSSISEKRDVSSANISKQIEVKPSWRLLMYIKNKSGSNTDPCGAPEFILFHSDVFPFKKKFVHDN